MFCKNQNRLLNGDTAALFFWAVLAEASGADFPVTDARHSGCDKNLPPSITFNSSAVCRPLDTSPIFQLKLLLQHPVYLRKGVSHEV